MTSPFQLKSKSAAFPWWENRKYLFFNKTHNGKLATSVDAREDEVVLHSLGAQKFGKEVEKKNLKKNRNSGHDRSNNEIGRRAACSYRIFVWQRTKDFQQNSVFLKRLSSFWCIAHTKCIFQTKVFVLRLMQTKFSSISPTNFCCSKCHSSLSSRWTCWSKKIFSITWKKIFFSECFWISWNARKRIWEQRHLSQFSRDAVCWRSEFGLPASL